MIALASLIVLTAGVWATSQLWDLAHYNEPRNQTRGLWRRARRWCKSL